jgi:ribonuclease III
MSLEGLQNLIGYSFKRQDVLLRALTHKSYCFEAGGTTGHNEILEFLGDSVLDLILSEFLMEKFPHDDEGGLSKKRASLVNEPVLAKVALELQLDQYLLLGKGESLSGGLKKPRLLASALEALIGAIFSDSGYEDSRRVVQEFFAKTIDEINVEADFEADFKTRLQELTQSEKRSTPTYKVSHESGPAHDREFEVEVWVNNGLLAKGKGKSKKAAEQEAARQALELLHNQGRHL